MRHCCFLNSTCDMRTTSQSIPSTVNVDIFMQLNFRTSSPMKPINFGWFIFCAYTILFYLFYCDHNFSLTSIFCASKVLPKVLENMYCVSTFTVFGKTPTHQSMGAKAAIDSQGQIQDFGNWGFRVTVKY